MRNDIEPAVRQIMADIFDLPLDRIDENTSMDNTEPWDSANHINLVLALEEEFGIVFEVAEIEGMISFLDVVQTVAAKS